MVWGQNPSLPGWQGRPHPVWSVGHGSSLAQVGSLIAKAFIGIRPMKVMRGTIHTRTMDFWAIGLPIPCKGIMKNKQVDAMCERQKIK